MAESFALRRVSCSAYEAPRADDKSEPALAIPAILPGVPRDHIASWAGNPKRPRGRGEAEIPQELPGLAPNVAGRR